jgi:carbon monoxide dehydrogenase subunit G
MPRRFSSSLSFNVPSEVLVDVLTSFETWSEWMPGLVDVDVLTEGPFDVGTRWRETRKVFGKDATEEFQVTRYDPPHSIELFVDGSKGSTGKGSYSFAYRFIPDGDGTTVELSGTIDMPGVFFRFLGGMLIGAFRKACDRDMQALGNYARGRLEEAGD